MFASLYAPAGVAPTALVPLQLSPDLFATPLGKLLVALVVVGVVLFVGRFVLSLASRVLKIAIVVVAVLWLLSVVVPALGG